MKLFITDYDGTLYTSDDVIKTNIKYLKKLQEKGFYIVISTGRSYPSIKEQINLYQIPYDYLCCADGSIIYDNKNKVINKYLLKKEIIPDFIKFYQTLDYEEIQYSYPDGYHNTLSRYNDLLGINICIATSLYNEKMKKDFFKLKNRYKDYNFLCYTHPNYSYLCVKPSNISKSIAIKYLQEKLNILDNDIYVIGDSSNDLEMIRDYNGVCMTNSYSDVLNIAKEKYDEVYTYIIDILKDN